MTAILPSEPVNGNRWITVITGSLLTVRCQGTRWEAVHYDKSDRVGAAIIAIGQDEQEGRCAAFTDVHAVYFEDYAELTVPDDGEDED